MTSHLHEYLQTLTLNRGVSAHTARAYESDLVQFLSFAARRVGVKRTDLTPQAVDEDAIRAFLAELYAKGTSRASAARKLAAVRSFARFLRQEGIIDHD